MKNASRILAVIAALALLGTGSACGEGTTLYVTVSELNGRSEPSKRASIEMLLEKGDAVTAIGYADGWVEIEGGESGTSWCKADYLSEISAPIVYVNRANGRVNVRDEIDGEKIVGHVAVGKRVTVERTMFGWGYTGRGWVDLSYFEAEEERK